MPLSKKLGAVGFAKQAARGAPAANPTFTLPKIGGGIKPAPEDADRPRTGTTLKRRGRYRKSMRAAGTITLGCQLEALGLLLYEVMGAQTATGVAPTEHVFTMAEALPENELLTVWDLVGDDWVRFSDVFVTKLTLMAAETEEATVAIDVVALDFTDVGAPTFTLLDDEPLAKYPGSAILLEADAAVPTALENVFRVELVIDRAPDIRHAAKLLPRWVIPDRLVDFTAGLIYDAGSQGWDFFREASMGGEATGGSPSQNIPVGSFDVTLGRHPEAAADRGLRIQSNGQNWEYGVERPDSEAGGGALEMDVAGILVDPGGVNSEVTVTLINDTAAVY